MLLVISIESKNILVIFIEIIFNVFEMKGSENNRNILKPQGGHLMLNFQTAYVKEAFLEGIQVRNVFFLTLLLSNFLICTYFNHHHHIYIYIYIYIIYLKILISTSKFNTLYSLFFVLVSLELERFKYVQHSFHYNLDI